MKTSPTKTETALPERRAKAGGASERAARPHFSAWPVGSGLVNALCRRVALAAEEVTERWPLGGMREDFPRYHKAVRRWMRLKRELEVMLIAGGGL